VIHGRVALKARETCRQYLAHVRWADGARGVVGRKSTKMLCAAENPSRRRRHSFARGPALTTIVPRGGCQQEPLTNDPGRWAWCAACLTLYDDYGIPVNPIPEYTKVH
jgi:hypothetical protein